MADPLQLSLFPEQTREWVYEQTNRMGVYFATCSPMDGVRAFKIGEAMRGWAKLNYFRRPHSSVRTLRAYSPTSRSRIVEEALKKKFAAHRLEFRTTEFQNDLSVELFDFDVVAGYLATRWGAYLADEFPVIISEADMAEELGLA